MRDEYDRSHGGYHGEQGVNERLQYHIHKGKAESDLKRTQYDKERKQNSDQPHGHEGMGKMFFVRLFQTGKGLLQYWIQ